MSFAWLGNVWRQGQPEMCTAILCPEKRSAFLMEHLDDLDDVIEAVQRITGKVRATPCVVKVPHGANEHPL
jgi:hypothetical protein